jgi:hypothetical protein
MRVPYRIFHLNKVKINNKTESASMDKVQHFEIPADDMVRAKKFYSSVFRWKIQDVPGMEYAMVDNLLELWSEIRSVDSYD